MSDQDHFVRMLPVLRSRELSYYHMGNGIVERFNTTQIQYNACFTEASMEPPNVAIMLYICNVAKLSDFNRIVVK